MADEHEDVEALIAERRAADARHTPGREPVGTATARRLLAVTVAVVAAATAVLVAALLLG